MNKSTGKVCAVQCGKILQKVGNYALHMDAIRDIVMGEKDCPHAHRHRVRNTIANSK